MLKCCAGEARHTRVHAPALPVTSWREESGSLWKTCGQDDESAERISSALGRQYWRALDRSPSPPVSGTYVPESTRHVHPARHRVRRSVDPPLLYQPVRRLLAENTRTEGPV